MTVNFGRGGKETGPAPLDFTGDKSEVNQRINQNRTNQGSSYPGYFPGSMGSTMNAGTSSSGIGKNKVSTPNEFSDMSTTDQLQDENIRNVRMQGYDLANKERTDDIRHKNDFNNIVKISMIIFISLIGIAFMVFFGVFGYLSISSGAIAEHGVLGTMLQTLIEIFKLALS